MTQYILSEDADRDMDGIWDYIAEDSIDAADQSLSCTTGFPCDFSISGIR